MKLGKPKRYTWFRNAIDTSGSSSSSSSPSSTSSNKVHENSQPSIIAMAYPNSQHHHHSNLVTSISSWLRVPKGRIFRQILATAICLILVYNVTSLAIETSSIPSSSSTGAVESLPAAAAALTLCESCEDDSSDASNQISQPQNGVNDKNYIGKHELPIVGTNAKTGSQGNLGKNHPDEVSSKTMQQSDNDSENNFAPPLPPPQPAETSGSNYIYYYTDDISNRNRRNQNINYDINSPGADGENGDSNSNSDNQVLTTNSRGDDDDDGNSGYANRDEMERNDNPMRSSNSNASSKSQKHSSDVMKLRNRQTEKRASKKLLNVQYQKRRKLLDSIFLSIKSTKRFHKTRLEPVISTWFNLARDQTWIFTDDDDLELNQKTNGHVINTHCPSTHYRQALCCKMSAEFDTFIKSQKSWFCHFDDDNYVNVPALLDLLSKYDHKEDWYLGKPSLKMPIKIPHPDNKSEEISFWFATGGAGFCLSRALAKRMSPVASGGKFTKLCDNIQLPDDVTMGYIAGHLLGRNLTVIPQFHSHYETMRFLDMKNPYPEITFSYVRYFDNSLNTLEIDGFTEEEDPTRFLSLHCLLFPNFSFCQKNKR